MNDDIIEFPQSQIKQYQTEINKILLALDKIEEGWGLCVFTDKSSLADFGMTEDELQLFSSQIKQEVEEEDYIFEIAKKMHDQI